jgi:hypothetical protein
VPQMPGLPDLPSPREAALAQRDTVLHPLHGPPLPDQESADPDSGLLPPRYLLEQRDVEVNVRDKWDSTPL